MSKVSNFQIFIIGLMLFSMFLGAGNVIFAPVLGQQAGTNTIIAMLGFLITGVGLVIIAIMALNKVGGTVEKISGRVGEKYALCFSVLLFLALGPLYVIPRTTSVVYEIGIRQLIPDGNHKLFLLLFSIFFMLLTIYLSWDTSKFVERLGKIITPIFGILLVLIVAKSIITPMGKIHPPVPDGSYVEPFAAFLKGFTQGYYTMDVLAAFIFGGIFIKSISSLGINDEKEIASVFLKAGFVTLIGLAALQISMAWIGASSVDSIGYSKNGGETIALACKQLFGVTGLYLIGTVIFLTGITTNIACLAAVSEYFERIMPSISYKKWLIFISIPSLIITNFGLTKVLEMASPLLMLLYPLAISLIVLVFTDRFFKGSRSVYIGTTIGVGFVAILEALKDFFSSTPTKVDAINEIFSFIPLIANGAGWITTGIIGGLLGYIFRKRAAS